MQELLKRKKGLRRSILIVDDDQIAREILGAMLKGLYEVSYAENGQVALDMVKASPNGYYDAILMDIQMPVMDRFTAAKCIRALENKAHANIPILAVTANAFKEDEEKAKEAGIQAHIAKPIDVNKLLGPLESVLSEYEK